MRLRAQLRVFITTPVARNREPPAKTLTKSNCRDPRGLICLDEIDARESGAKTKLIRQTVKQFASSGSLSSREHPSFNACKYLRYLVPRLELRVSFVEIREKKEKEKEKEERQ